MTHQSVEARLAAMGLELPAAPSPVAAYVPAVTCGNLVFTSGQIPLVKGELACKGTVGKDCTEEQAQEAAKICALNCLAVIKAQIGSLDRIERIVKVVGFVNCMDTFTMQPKVINGASEFLARCSATRANTPVPPWAPIRSLWTALLKWK